MYICIKTFFIRRFNRLTLVFVQGLQEVHEVQRLHAQSTPAGSGRCSALKFTHRTVMHWYRPDINQPLLCLSLNEALNVLTWPLREVPALGTGHRSPAARWSSWCPFGKTHHAAPLSPLSFIGNVSVNNWSSCKDAILLLKNVNSWDFRCSNIDSASRPKFACFRKTHFTHADFAFSCSQCETKSLQKQNNVERWFLFFNIFIYRYYWYIFSINELTHIGAVSSI